MGHVLKPYPTYKRSSAPWLDKTPEPWDELPAFAAYTPKSVKNAGLREKTVLSLSFGRIVIKPEEKLHGLVPESFEGYQVVEPGDIIVRTTDLQNDRTSLRVGMSQNHGIITSAYMCLRARNTLTPSYAYQLLNAYDLLKVLYGFGSGLRQNLEFSHIKRMPVPIPPPADQDAIVRYLEHADGRIRRYIAAKRTLIEAMNEQKGSVIHHAVTRGLDPHVHLKPSGVEWLGDVPEHWEIRRMRHVAHLLVSGVDKHVIEGESEVRLCNYVDVYKHETIRSGMPFMKATATPSEIARFRLHKDDVVITKDSEDWKDIGVPAYVAEEAPDLLCGYHLAILRPRPGLSGRYLHRQLQSPRMRVQFSIRANGVTRYGLSHGGIKDVVVLRPPASEQTAIAQFLDQATADLDRAITAARSEIALLREYRAGLVADVVTGKIDVRDLAAHLPQEKNVPEVESEERIEASDELADGSDMVTEETEA